VGLGKTIEASIIYKELAIRGLARRVLILTPASLVGQWQGELEQKFFERFDTPSEPDDWLNVTKAIVSHDRARSRRHAEEILRHRWDLVIVDEAHKVKSQRGATYQFIEKIERDFILLLTATPLQNDLRELYNLVTLLRPGQLGTWPEFRKVHLVAGDHRMPKDPAALRALTHEVMIRTRRTSVIDDLNLPPRRARHPEVRLTKAEADLYQGTTEFLRRLYREGFVQPAGQEEGTTGREPGSGPGGGSFSSRSSTCASGCAPPRAHSPSRSSTWRRASASTPRTARSRSSSPSGRRASRRTPSSPCSPIC
jgi:SNF2 family DNA or RNA helicase